MILHKDFKKELESESSNLLKILILDIMQNKILFAPKDNALIEPFIRKFYCFRAESINEIIDDSKYFHIFCHCVTKNFDFFSNPFLIIAKVLFFFCLFQKIIFFL